MRRPVALALAGLLAACASGAAPDGLSLREMALARALVAEAERLARLSDEDVAEELARPVGTEAPPPRRRNGTACFQSLGRLSCDPGRADTQRLAL